MSRLPSSRVVTSRVIVGMALSAALGLSAASPARAQMESREGIALQNQILELRHQLQDLRNQGAQGGGAPVYQTPPAYQPPGGGGSNDLSATLLDRVTQLEDQVRQLRGRIDEIDNSRQQAEADLSKQIGDLQFKLNGGAGPAAPGASGPALSPPSGYLGGGRAAAPPPPPPVRRTPEVALAAGNAALARRDYPAAEAAAREVLATGRGPRGADAQYLLAQALLGQRNYAAAAVAYDDSYKRNGRGARGADSLVGLANSLNGLGDKLAACQTLDKLRAEYPAPSVGLRPSIAAARSRAGCH